MTTRGGGSWLSSLLSRSAAPATARGETEPQGLEEDDDWSDTSSDVDSTTASSNRNIRSVDDIPDISPEDEARLLPNMPALFGTDLPPCGLIPQVAYENVVNRLRKLWLQHAAANPIDVSTLDICFLVLDDLKTEAENSPPGSELHTKARRPWRRETVFGYEIKWAEYFVREAEVLEKRPTMNEEERDKQDFQEKLFPIPKELKFLIGHPNKPGVLELWCAWHQKKRWTHVEGIELSDTGGEPSKTGDGQDAGEDTGEATAPPENSEMSVIDTSDTEGEREENKQGRVRHKEEGEVQELHNEKI